MIGVRTHGIEQRLAHVEHGTIEHEGVRVLLGDELGDLVGEARGEHVIAVIAQRERQQLGDLGGVVDEQNARQITSFVLRPWSVVRPRSLVRPRSVVRGARKDEGPGTRDGRTKDQGLSTKD